MERKRTITELKTLFSGLKGKPITDQMMRELINAMYPSEANLSAIYNIFNDLKDPTGFVDPRNIVVTWNKTARTVTVSHASGVIEYYWNGVKKQLTSPWTSGQHGTESITKYLFSSDGDAISWADASWLFSQLQVSLVTAGRYFAIREVHGATWGHDLHDKWHNSLGTMLLSGGGLVANTFALNTDTDAANNPSFAACSIFDEDCTSDLALWAEGSYTHLWFTAAGTINFALAQSNVVKASGSFAFVNLWNGSAFTWAETVQNRYLNYYVIRIPVTADADSQQYRAVVLHPQFAYTSQAAAEAEDTKALRLGDFTSLSPEFVLVERITYKTASGNTSTGKVQMVSNAVLKGSRISQVAVSGVVAQTAENISVDPSTFNGILAATDVNLQLVAEKVDDHVHDGRYYTETEINNLINGYSTTGHTHTFASITDKPTTLSGYGITDAYTKTEINNTLAAYETITGAAGKYSVLGHTHDNRYYTETESDNRFQPLGNELTALQALADTAGFLKKTGDGAYSIDTNSYALSSQINAAGLTTNYIPYWDGSKLVDSTATINSDVFNIERTNYNDTEVLAVKNNATSGGALSTKIQLYVYNGTGVVVESIIRHTGNTWNYGNVLPNQMNINSYGSGGTLLHVLNSANFTWKSSSNGDESLYTELMKLTGAGKFYLSSVSGTGTRIVLADTNGQIIENTGLATNFIPYWNGSKLVDSRVTTTGTYTNQFGGAQGNSSLSVITQNFANISLKSTDAGNFGGALQFIDASDNVIAFFGSTGLDGYKGTGIGNLVSGTPLVLITNNANRLIISETGTITIPSLAGTGVRLVTTDANGLLDDITGATEGYIMVGTGATAPVFDNTLFVDMASDLIGIGKTPTNKLHVYSTTAYQGITIDGNNNPSLLFSNTGTTKGFIALPTSAGEYSTDASANDLVIRTEATGQKILFNVNGGSGSSMMSLYNGNTGFGYTDPETYRIKVNGTGFFNGKVTVTNFQMTTGASANYILKSDASGNALWASASVTETYKGTWNANTNTPTLANGTGTAGDYYICSTAGTTDFGAGGITFSVGDRASYNGSIWQFVAGVGYTLQIATASVLGGVKIGTGVSIDGNGIISVSTAYRADTWVPAWSDISSKPTTLSGFGITNAYTKTESDDAYQPLSTVLTNTTASFTTTLETKLNGIAAGAEVNVNADWNSVTGDSQILNKPTLGTWALKDYPTWATGTPFLKMTAAGAFSLDTTVYQPLSTVLTNTTASFTSTLETKLNGIATGAEVNVNADWNSVTGDSEILNKPTLGTFASKNYATWSSGTQLMTMTAAGTFGLASFGTGASDVAAGNHNHTGTYDNYQSWNLYSNNSLVKVISSGINTHINAGTGVSISATTSDYYATLTISATGAMTYPSTTGIVTYNGSTWGSSITDNSTNWNTAATNSHTHSNKSTLDAIEQALTTALKSNYDVAYSHSQTTHQTIINGTGFVYTSGVSLSYDNTVLVDADFEATGIMLRGENSGDYDVITNNSATWNTAIVDADFSANGLMIRTSGTTYSTIADGTANYFLKTNGSGTYSWAAADPMTTRGDIMYRNSSNVTARLGIGGNGTFLSSNGTDVSWAASTGMADPMTTRGDLIYRNASNVTARLGIGATGSFLYSNGTDISWGAGLINPMTTAGDMIIGGTSGLPSRLAYPGFGYSLVSYNSNVVQWDQLWYKLSGNLYSTLTIDHHGAGATFDSSNFSSGYYSFTGNNSASNAGLVTINNSSTTGINGIYVTTGGTAGATYAGQFIATASTGGIGVYAAGGNHDMWLGGSGRMLMKHGTSGSPSTGYATIYVKSDGNLYLKNGSATEVVVGSQSSDFWLKKDFRKLETPLEKILQVNGYAFNWKPQPSPFAPKDAIAIMLSNDTGKRDASGVIAQELEKLIPEAVNTNADGYKSVNFNQVVPYLIEAVKELNNKIETLESKLSKYE